MAKPKSNTAADAAETNSVATAHAPDSEASAAAAAPAAEVDPAQALAAAGATPEDGATTDPADSAGSNHAAEVEVCDVRVLAPVTIGCERFDPNDVIEGLPLALAEAHAGSVDTHPDAVAYARSTGSPVKPFEPLAE